MKQKGERGDTLIEVLLAMAILSAIIVGAITMMNRGHAIARDSLERSQVTALMTEQAEILRYVRDSYDPSDPGPLVPPASLWKDLVDNWTATAEDTVCKTNTNPFYLQKTLNPTGEVEPKIVDFDESTINLGSSNYVETHAKPGSGLWVEAEPPAGAGGVEYIDFHIKGCWSPSGEGPQQEAKTIVRLYMPTYVPPTFGGGGVDGDEDEDEDEDESCTSVASTFTGDKWVGAAGSGGATSVTIPLNGSLNVGCKYEFMHLWGDFHPGQKATCEAGAGSPGWYPGVCNTWKQPYESYYIEFLRADGTVGVATPNTGDIPDEFSAGDPDVVYNPNGTSNSSAKKLYYNLNVTPAVGEITAIRLMHSTQTPTDYNTNSAHIYGYLFQPD